MTTGVQVRAPATAADITMRWSLVPSHAPPRSAVRPRTTSPSGIFSTSAPRSSRSCRVVARRSLSLMRRRPALMKGLALGEGRHDRENRDEVGDLGRVDCHAAKRAGAHRHGVFRHGNLRAEGLKKLHDRPVPLAGVCTKPRQRDAPAQSARAEPEGAVRPVAFDFGGAGASQPLEPLDGEPAPVFASRDSRAEEREYVERHVDVGRGLDPPRERQRARARHDRQREEQAADELRRNVGRDGVVARREASFGFERKYALRREFDAVVAEFLVERAERPLGQPSVPGDARVEPERAGNGQNESLDRP